LAYIGVPDKNNKENKRKEFNYKNNEIKEVALMMITLLMMMMMKR